MKWTIRKEFVDRLPYLFVSRTQCGYLRKTTFKERG